MKPRNFAKMSKLPVYRGVLTLPRMESGANKRTGRAKRATYRILRIRHQNITFYHCRTDRVRVM